MMKAQVSIEYLMLSFVALALISFSLYALSGIKDYSQDATEAYIFRSSAVTLGNAVREVCALGDGNRRSYSLKRGIDVDSVRGDEEWLVEFTADDLTMVSNSPCEVRSAYGLKGPVLIENEDGKIEIRER